MQPQGKLSKKSPQPSVVLRLADVDTDDGPQPLRGCKPGAKKANAADQFWSDYQKEHEKRAEIPARVDVQEFNKVPRLAEPLNKRGAVTKIKASATLVAKQSSDHHEPKTKSSENICQKCRKLRMLEKKRRHKTHTSHSRLKKQELKSRITKSNSRQKNMHKTLFSRSALSLVERSKKCRCRYCMRVTNRGTCTNMVLKEASTITALIFDHKNLKRGRTGDTGGSNTPNGSIKSDITNSQNSGAATSLHSGSFNSNLSHLSLDHEPMVTNEE